jgi:hypothetical protein
MLRISISMIHTYCAALQVAALLLAVVVTPLPVVTMAQEEQQRIFFFGNSYTSFHGGMEKMVAALLEESLGVTVKAKGRYRNAAKLSRHLADLDGSNGDNSARQALITGNNTRWNLVILQDQSAVPAYVASDLFKKSRKAGVQLHKLIAPTGAVTMFLLTWGRQRGLKNGFRDFPSMQHWLNQGYREYQKAASTSTSSTSSSNSDAARRLAFVAPAGVAFQLVYDQVIANGGSATSKNFRQLYGRDGSHPSDQGSYLAACVIFCAYTGRSVQALEWAPGSMSAERRDYLQGIADQAVFEHGAMFGPYPWSSSLTEEVYGNGNGGTDDDETKSEL